MEYDLKCTSHFEGAVSINGMGVFGSVETVQDKCLFCSTYNLSPLNLSLSLSAKNNLFKFNLHFLMEHAEQPHDSERSSQVVSVKQDPFYGVHSI